MHKKRIFLFSLLSFFSIWGLFGFAAIFPRGEVFLQATPPSVETTPVAPAGTLAAGIPVTGEPEPVWTEILVFYGLIGVTALFLILAMLILASRSSVPHVRKKGTASGKADKN